MRGRARGSRAFRLKDAVRSRQAQDSALGGLFARPQFASIPEPATDDLASTYETAKALKDAVNVIGGQTDNILDRYVSVRDLVALGIIGEDGKLLLDQRLDELELRQEFAFYRVMAGIFRGRVDNGPLPTDFTVNIATAERVGVGVYRFTVVTNNIRGANIVERSIFMLEPVIAGTADTQLFEVQYVSVDASTFEVHVLAVVQGTGNRLDFIPYDILATDSVHMGAWHSRAYTPD